MAEPLLRRLVILQHLPEYPRKLSTRQLLASLENEGISTSLRTIQRDLEYLSGCGLFAIGGDKDSKHVGWYWLKGHRKTMPYMDQSTAVGFKLLKALVSDKLPSSVNAKINAYFDQAEQLLSTNEGWANKVLILKERATRKVPPQDNVLDVICDAIDRNVCLSMDIGRYYKGIDLDYLHYNPIHPIGLITSGETVYLAHFRGEHRRPYLVPIHHIRNVNAITQEACFEALDFDIKNYAESLSLSEVFEKRKRHCLDVSVKVARYLIEQPIADDQNIEVMERGYYRITFTADDTAALRGKIKMLEAL